MKLAVIGGGIAGLATAWYARRAATDAGEALELRVFEGSQRFGGKIISEARADCLLEGGPDSLLTEKPWGLELCRELGLGDELLASSDAQRSFSILHQNRLHPFPAGCKLFIPQKVSPILTSSLLGFPAKLRMLAEPLIRHRRPEADESLASFTRRHFGQEALDRLAGPLLGGIYGGDPEDMSMAATFPRLRELERRHGSLVLGMRGLMRQAGAQQRAGTAPSLFTTLAPGMQALTESLAAHLAGDLVPGHRVGRLEKDGKAWRVDGEAFDGVVVALPARAAAPLFAGEDDELTALLRAQAYSSSATVSLVFARRDVPHPPSGFGFMAAHPLESPLVGCTWTGNKFRKREAADRFACRVFLGGPLARALIADADDGILVRTALDALRKVCPFLPEAPLAVWPQRWPDGNPGYAVGHLDWVARIRRRCQSLGQVQLCGSSYDGVSVSDCVRQARETARALWPPPAARP